MSTIKITIAPDGEVKMEGEGFKGKACDLATKAFEEALGGQQDKRRKAEYYNTTTKASQQCKTGHR